MDDLFGLNESTVIEVCNLAPWDGLWVGFPWGGATTGRLLEGGQIWDRVRAQQTTAAHKGPRTTKQAGGTRGRPGLARRAHGPGRAKPGPAPERKAHVRLSDVLGKWLKL